MAPDKTISIARGPDGVADLNASSEYSPCIHRACKKIQRIVVELKHGSFVVSVVTNNAYILDESSVYWNGVECRRNGKIVYIAKFGVVGNTSFPIKATSYLKEEPEELWFFKSWNNFQRHLAEFLNG